MKHVRDLTKYIKESDRILIVSPHPDDEVLGCGGLIAKYAKQIDILLLTSGEDNEEAKTIRLKEYENAMRISNGINNTIVLNIPLYKIKKNYRLINSIDIKKYDFIFIPGRNEHHADHSCLYKIYRKIIAKQHSKALLIEYESTTPLRALYWYIKLEDELLEKKRQMMKEYQSQICGYDYDGLICGLNQYRGALIGGMKYAECYYQTPKYLLLKKIYNKLLFLLRK